MLGDHAFEAGALVTAERGEPGQLDQVVHRGAVVLLDHAVELDEGHAELFGQHPAERRLAGAAQADERDAPRPVGGATRRNAAFDQFGKRSQFGRRHAQQEVEDAVELRRGRAAARQQFEHGHVERLGDPPEHDGGGIALPALDLREVALRGAGILRQLPPRHAALGARKPHEPPDRGGEVTAGTGGGGGTAVAPCARRGRLAA